MYAEGKSKSYSRYALHTIKPHMYQFCKVLTFQHLQITYNKSTEKGSGISKNSGLFTDARLQHGSVKLEKSRKNVLTVWSLVTRQKGIDIIKKMYFESIHFKLLLRKCKGRSKLTFFIAC
jgi:hypothetical protein